MNDQEPTLDTMVAVIIFGVIEIFHIANHHLPVGWDWIIIYVDEYSLNLHVCYSLSASFQEAEQERNIYGLACT